MKIEPDQGLLLAWARATTGANEHDMERTRWYYMELCKSGDQEKLKDTVSFMYRRLRHLFKQDGYDLYQRNC